MSMDEWTPDAIRAYKQVIHRAPKSRAKAEAQRRGKLDRMFTRLHGKTVSRDR